LIDVPLQFVVGKGGVGKSTLTAALALESGARGLRTLAIEFGGSGGLARLFDAEGVKPGVPRVVAPRVTMLALEGDEALAEYLGMVVPIKRVLGAIFSSNLYRVFVAGAPGLKELMTVGKVWYEADRRTSGSEPIWQRIFVDAGASGHSLQYLQMPRRRRRRFEAGSCTARPCACSRCSRIPRAAACTSLRFPRRCR
jgi:anion-transporting  ArsA/GET3 family ATPase